MHLDPLIIDLAIIIAVAGFMTIVFQKIRQPVVLGYILAGIVVGPHTPPVQLIVDSPSIQTLAELGVIFLMFTLGLEFSFRRLLSVGVTASVSAALEVIFFVAAGYGIGHWLGWTPMDSLFLGAMLSISSTTIIIKALDELKLKSHRFANLIFGILVVEDLFAILLLVGLTTIASTQSFSVMALLSAGINLLMVVGGWFITGYFIVPRLMSYLGRRGSNEIVTLISIGLCLGLVVLASRFGYSPALGAFIMGSILAETRMVHRIEGLMAPLKDLFGAIFFVSIGMLIDPKIIWEYKETILLLSFVTIFGKIFITSFGALLTGQTFKNSMMVGMGLAQIGEFSFIIAGLGVALKATTSKLYPIAVAVSVVTTFTTPYLIKHSSYLAQKMENLLPWWLRRTLNKYVDWYDVRKDNKASNREVATLFSRWAANGIVMTLVFNNSRKILSPIFENQFHISQEHTRILTWLIAFVVSSPFIWGMVFTSRRNIVRIRKERNVFRAGLVVAFPILTSIWICIVSAKFFSLIYVLLITASFLTIIYFTLFKRLEGYYRWFEKTFLETFEKKEVKEDTHKVLAKLAPWDSHLINIPVHPNAELVQKTLTEAGLRNKFGINIVAIQRGAQSIIAPHPTELILPNDTLVVLGTDEQLDRVRPLLDVPHNISSMFSSSLNYRLKCLRLTPQSQMVNHTIRESGIREKYQAMVVGIERNSTRIVNPDTDLQLLAQDILWVVGENSKLDTMIKES